MSRFFATSPLLCLPLPALGPAAADELRVSPARLLEISASDNVRRTSDGTAIELARGVLIEDDGPAAGYSYRPSEERPVGIWLAWKFGGLLTKEPEIKPWYIYDGADINYQAPGPEFKLKRHKHAPDPTP